MYKNGLLHDSYISSGLGPGNSKSLCIRVRIRVLLLRISSQTSTSANLQYKGVLDGGTSFEIDSILMLDTLQNVHDFYHGQITWSRKAKSG